MGVLGGVMYLGSKYGFSAAPMVLGIILGPIAEDNFQMGKMIADTGEGVFSYFFLGTINIVLVLICMVSVGYSIVAELKQRNSQQSSGIPVDEENLVAGISATVISVIVLAAVFLSGSGEAFFFPRLLAVLMTLLSLMVLWGGLRRLTSIGRQADSQAIEWHNIAAGIAVMAGYVLVLEKIGFYVSSFLAFALIVFVYMPQRDRRTAVTFVTVSVGFTGLVYLVFEHMLQVITPGGMLF